MIRHLLPKGIRIPNRFATTAQAYRRFLEFNGLDVKLRTLFAGLSVEDLNQLRQVGSQARALILEASFPEDLDRAIRGAYARLCEQYGPNPEHHHPFKRHSRRPTRCQLPQTAAQT